MQNGLHLGADLYDKPDGVLQGDVLLVVLLEQVLRGLLVGADGRGPPAAVVAAGVALVQLEPPVLVPARTNESLSFELSQFWLAEVC
jgi:hypothetical protein